MSKAANGIGRYGAELLVDDASCGIDGLDDCGEEECKTLDRDVEQEEDEGC